MLNVDAGKRRLVLGFATKPHVLSSELPLDPNAYSFDFEEISSGDLHLEIPGSRVKRGDAL